MEITTQNMTPTSLERAEEIERLNSITYDLRSSYIWVVFCLGFPGNIFSIITILTMRTMTPATFFVAFLALGDGLTLLLKIISHQIFFHKVHVGDIGCKMDFLNNYTASVANWILVLICAERFVAVCLPLKKNIIFTKRRCYIIVLLISVVFFVLFCSMFWLMRAAMIGGIECGTDDVYLEFWKTGWYWISICLNLFIPLPIIILFTALIIRGLRISRRDRRCILRNGSGNEETNMRLIKESERLERSITFMLVLAAFFFAALSIPTMVFLLAYEESEDELVTARWLLFDQIQYLCIDSTHAVNFFIYFLSAKRFREQFLYLLTCHRWSKGVQKRKVVNDVTHSSCATKYTIAKSSEDVSHI